MFKVSLLMLLGLGSMVIGTSSSIAKSLARTALSDGAHDFDFDFGVWHSHITHTPDPVGAPDVQLDMAGTVSVSPICTDKGALEEIDADGSKGHWQGMRAYFSTIPRQGSGARPSSTAMRASFTLL